MANIVPKDEYRGAKWQQQKVYLQLKTKLTPM